MTQTVLGIDFGPSKTGVAVGQTVTGTAQALETVSGSPDTVVARLGALVDEWQADALVVGLPLPAPGDEESRMCKNARAFAGRLERDLKLPVHLVDERLTSSAAARQLRDATPAGKAVTARRRRQRDALAAQLILETWLNTNRAESRRNG